MKKIILIIGGLIIAGKIFCQGDINGSNRDLGGEEINTVQSAVPFLTISPDSRAAAMGDVGVATSPDLNSQHWNPAKFPFIEENAGVTFSYVPWLRKLGINDINLLYLSGFKRFDKLQALSGSFRYFTLGEIIFTNDQGQVIKPASPNEFALDVAYSRLLGKSFSGSVGFRFIRSDLSQNVSVQGKDTYAGIAFAADVAFYYQHNIQFKDNDGILSFGLNISNVGNKIRYSESTADFLPINMRLGSSLKINLDDYNSFAFSIDFNKLMIPTRPVYWGKDSVDANGKLVIRYGKGDPDASVPVAMFRSFYDAPGFPIDTVSNKTHVFREELREITVGIGAEYWYAKQFAARAGYFYEDATKGNRKYFTLGVGLRYNVFGLDVSYLVSNQNNPLANTIRFTLLFSINTGQSKKHH